MSAQFGSEDGEELQNVLGRLRKDDRNAVMLRVALRQLPYVCRLSAFSGSENIKILINQTFRSVIVARVAIANIGLGNAARAQLGACANGLRFAQQSSFNMSDGLGGSALDDEPVILANSALASVRAALETITANDAALSHQSYISRLALRGGGDRAVYADLRQIQDEPSISLIGLPLWLDDVREDEQKRANIPPAERAAFDQFAMLGIGAKQPWSVWVDWYRGILPSGPYLDPQDIFSTASLRSILGLPAAFWDREPDQVAKTVGDIQRSPYLADEWTGRATTPEPQDDESRAANNVLKGRPSETPQITDETRGNRDAPTTEDRLGRRPFAHKLVDLIEGLKADTKAFDFAIHMHAPWGVGKSSVIAMMTEILQDRTRKDAENWAVFTFNAWEHEHRKLPWWPFLRLLRKASIDEKKRRGAWTEVLWTWALWWMRRLGDFIAPILFALAAVSLLCWLLISQGLFVADTGIDWPKIAGLIAGGTTLFLTFTALGRRLLFGAKEQSDFYFSLSRNPWKRVRSRFRHLAGGLARPVCIFIDDLDRCQAKYVVDVLTGIQTHFRKDNVVFVIAADRKWLRTSFETAFSDFVGKSGQQEDRLGYLFLEKVFQLSVPLPRIPSFYRESYIRELLDDDEMAEQPGALGDSKAFDEALRAQQTEGGTATEPPVETASPDSEAQARPTAREAARKTADALEKSASQTETRAAKHRLRDLIDCFPSNPRVIKRVINAYGVHMFEAFFEDLNVSEERRNLIARWAILEQCYPALIDILVDEPDLANCFHPEDAERTPVPDGPEFRQFADLAAVTALFVADDVLQLTPDVVREFTEGQRG